VVAELSASLDVITARDANLSRFELNADSCPARESGGAGRFRGKIFVLPRLSGRFSRLQWQLVLRTAARDISDCPAVKGWINTPRKMNQTPVRLCRRMPAWRYNSNRLAG